MTVETELERQARAMSETDVARLKKFVKAAELRQPYLDARKNFLKFAEVMSPDREHPKDPRYSRYKIAPHHRLIGEALMRVEDGTIPRVIFVMPPRHGKSETVTRLFPPWFVGRDPSREVIIAGYSQKFAERSFGKKIQTIMQSARYREVFPDATLDGGSKAVDALMLGEGGQIIVSGRGGALTGHGAHLLLIDDPIKNKKEAESQVVRDDVWEWFTSTAYSRLYDSGAAVIVTTRWNEDDLVGRLTNPEHPEHDPEIARGWKVICLPAVFEDRHAAIGKVLGKKTGDVLWPREGDVGFSREYFEIRRRMEPGDFEALYQGDPSPMDGDIFKVEWLRTYKSDELPDVQFLSKYGASDHGVTTRNRSDPSVIGCVGVDEDGVVYVLPDLIWDKLQTDRIVEEIIAKMRYHKPFAWWMESENISKAFGPFLYKQMAEEKVYTVIEPRSPSKDKVTRSQALRGLMAHGRIRFPSDAWWWPAAKRQLLTFPNAAANDFVDFLSWIGLGVMELVPGQTQKAKELEAHDIPGTIAWIKHQTKIRENRENAENARRIGY